MLRANTIANNPMLRANTIANNPRLQRVHVLLEVRRPRGVVALVKGVDLPGVRHLVKEPAESSETSERRQREGRKGRSTGHRQEEGVTSPAQPGAKGLFLALMLPCVSRNSPTVGSSVKPKTPVPTVTTMMVEEEYLQGEKKGGEGDTSQQRMAPGTGKEATAETFRWHRGAAALTCSSRQP